MNTTSRALAWSFSKPVHVPSLLLGVDPEGFLTQLWRTLPDYLSTLITLRILQTLLRDFLPIVISRSGSANKAAPGLLNTSIGHGLRTEYTEFYNQFCWKARFPNYVSRDNQIARKAQR